MYVLSKEALNTIFWVFGMTRPGIEPRSPGPFVNTLLITSISHTKEKTQKMVLDASLLNTQYYMVRIKGKVDQSREWSSVLLYTSV